MALKHFASQVQQEHERAHQAAVVLEKSLVIEQDNSHVLQKPRLASVSSVAEINSNNEASTSVNTSDDVENETALNNSKPCPLSLDDQKTLCALSAMQIRYGRPAEAVSYLMMVRKVNPENAESIRLLALAFMRLGRWNEAEVMVTELDQLQNETSHNIGDGIILLYQSIVAFKTNKISEAKSWFVKFRSFVKASVRGAA